MEHQTTQSIYIARAISRFTNPTVLSVITLLLIAVTKSDSLIESVGWFGIIFLFFVLIPAIYVLVRSARNGNQIKSLVGLTKFLKQHPIDILVMALILGLSCLIILWLLKAPAILISTIIALAAGSIVTSLCNLFYKVSFHLTGITILIVMATQAWGQPYLFLLITIPPIAWAKFVTHDHTIPQIVIGIIVAMAISLGTLQLGILK